MAEEDAVDGAHGHGDDADQVAIGGIDLGGPGAIGGGDAFAEGGVMVEVSLADATGSGLGQLVVAQQEVDAVGELTLQGGDEVEELVRLRAGQPALRSDNVHPYYVCDADRVLAFHRWLPPGQDVVVVATLAESTWWNYHLGFPLAGFWQEVFNSDVYDNWVNPWAAGNSGGVQADGPPMHGFAASASLVIPANGIVVFARG